VTVPWWETEPLSGGQQNKGWASTHGKEQVLLILVDSLGVWNGICVFDDRHTLPYKQQSYMMSHDHSTAYSRPHGAESVTT